MILTLFSVQFFNSAIVLPEANGIETHMPILPSMRRNLLLIATVLHKTATGKLFSATTKSSGASSSSSAPRNYYEPINALIEGSGDMMTGYFEQLIDVPEPSEYLLRIQGHGDNRHKVVERFLPVLVPQNTLTLFQNILTEFVQDKETETTETVKLFSRILTSIGSTFKLVPLDKEDLVMLSKPDTLEPPDLEQLSRDDNASTPMTPNRQRKANLLQDVSDKLCVVLKGLNYCIGFQDNDMMTVLERERADAQTCGNYTLAAQLFETIYCIKEVEKDMLGEDYCMLLDLVDHQVRSRETKMGVDRKDRLLSLMTQQLELQALHRTIANRRKTVLDQITNIKFMSFVERQAKLFNTFYEAFFNQYGDPHTMSSASERRQSSTQLLGHAKNCGFGPAKFEEEEFVCPACMGLYETKRNFVVSFLQRVINMIKTDVLWRNAPEDEL
eukprot:TRINITY_DN2927_c0_g1_i4.p1 TRINITY_DN2927_c0_g1~~TRINITY_DN2927_c0_g1_i4.p1  ORF type:complete len:443 (+),score=126.42 TRINITY_DN2927_c0_g1_i4:263-1591(+)